MPLMEIIGQTMTSAYIEACTPVFSGQDFGHFTLVTNSVFILGGRQIRCDRCPSWNLSSSSSILGNERRKWTITCNFCNYTTRFKAPDDDQIHENDKEVVSKVPGGNYLRTPYPLLQARLSWRLKETTIDGKRSSTKAMVVGSLPVEQRQKSEVSADLIPILSKLKLEPPFSLG